MKARLYGVSFSHPSLAARRMLEFKGIEYEWVKIPAGAHAPRVRLAGFSAGTVPALKIDGRRVVGSRQISRVLDGVPEPALFPADPARRAAVEEAECWGDEVLQPIPRRLFRWALYHHAEARETFAGAMAPGRAAGVVARVMGPVAAYYSRREDARSTDRIRADVDALPAHLDHAEQLIADGVIGAAQLNAADFQIGSTLRVLLGFEDFAPLVAGRPLEALAHRVLPEYRFSVPSLIGLLPPR